MQLPATNRRRRLRCAEPDRGRVTTAPVPGVSPVSLERFIGLLLRPRALVTAHSETRLQGLANQVRAAVLV
ncbi:hypothetical protein ASG71_11755 [Arthrobacter sp. Soil763]|nr:hypothetical protein ASG71_11755 [Arthrobacter sp. Soil763]